jgi:hypothetical protein
MYKLEALLKVCFWIFMAYTFILADYKNPIQSGKLFVLLAVICSAIGIWAVYRDYKKDQLALT